MLSAQKAHIANASLDLEFLHVSIFILGNPFVLVLFTASTLLNILSHRHPHCMHYNHKGHENKQPWVTHFLPAPSPFVWKEPHNNNSIDLRCVLFIAKPCQKFNYKYTHVVNGALAASVRSSSGKKQEAERMKMSRQVLLCLDFK